MPVTSVYLRFALKAGSMWSLNSAQGRCSTRQGAAKCADGDVKAGALEARPGEALQVLSTPTSSFSAPLPCDSTPPQPYSHIKTVPHFHGPLIWPSISLPAAAGLFSAPLLGEQKGHSRQGHGLSTTALPPAVLPRGFQAVEGRGRT